MRLNRLARFALAASLAAAPILTTTAIAATPAEVKPGMQVVDQAGGTVGMVTAVKGDTLVLKTDKHELHLPLASFTANEGKLLFGMTAAQLNQEADKQLASAAAALAVGANVYGPGGTLAGQIEAIDGELFTVKLTSGESVRLPRTSLAPGANGATLGLSVEELKKLAAEAAATDQPSQQ